jgi:hypothetical protein
MLGHGVSNAAGTTAEMNNKTEKISQLDAMISARSCGLACCQRLMMEDMLIALNHTVRCSIATNALIALIVMLPLLTTAEAHAGEPTELTSVRYKTWIWPKPKKGGRFLGYMRVGQQVALRSPELVRGEGCRKGFYRIQPHGYVCNDRTVTVGAETAFLRANKHTLPRSGAFPYEFAISNGAPMYGRLPNQKEQKRSEWQYGKAGTFTPLSMFQRGHEHLAVTDPIEGKHAVPPFLASGTGARPGHIQPLVRRTLPHGTMMSFMRSFDFGGRTFLLSTDLTVVPADRVRRFKKSRFAGTKLNAGVKLPIAWFRGSDRPVYAMHDGVPQASSGRFSVRSFVQLSGEKVSHGKRSFLKTRDGRWVDASDATVVEHYGKRPFGVKPGDKWILVSITQGTLVAYDDLTPVFSTLVSSGLGGLPRKGGDLVKDSTTPLGTHKITFKDRAATMSPEFGEDRSFWIADVPFTQYFRAPFALHTAYWHEKFGELMSGGCINVSPLDGAWLFDWTGPHVPDGWQGASGGGFKEIGVATWVVVRR